MTDILFTHSYFLRFDPKQWKQQQPYPPLGTIYAAAVMREAGYKTMLFDTMFAESAEEVMIALDSGIPKYFVVYDDGFNYLTKMCLTNMREAAFRMCKIAKEKGCKVIVSSSDATDHYVKYLKEDADFVIIGEAEQTLLELVNAIEKGENSYENINGLAYIKESEIVLTSKRNVLKNLDEIPWPAWDLIDIPKYRNAWMKKNGYFSLNMVTTRGCPYKCNWCAKPIYGNRYNSRSTQNVVQELQFLIKNFRPDHIWFSDDIFGLKPGWAQEFADLVVKEKLNFRFKIQSRVDLLVKENTVEALAKAGCENIWVGAESGSQKILDAMDKGTQVSQIYEATSLMKKHGIKPAFFLQFGYLGETKEDIRSTMKMLLENMPYDIGISVSYPLPGTKFHENVKAQLTEKTNWTDSDELALMFRSTFAPVYYKRLHRYVHKVFRREQGKEIFKKMLLKPLSLGNHSVLKVLSLAYYIPAAVLDKVRLKRLENFK